MSVRELARVHRVHRRTVRTALTDSTPPPRKAPARVAPAIGPWLEIVRARLVADLDAPRKQRHTARRLWQRLVDEYGTTVAESTVCHAVAKIRRELIGPRSMLRSRKLMHRGRRPRLISVSSRP